LEQVKVVALIDQFLRVVKGRDLFNVAVRYAHFFEKFLPSIDYRDELLNVHRSLYPAKPKIRMHRNGFFETGLPAGIGYE